MDEILSVHVVEAPEHTLKVVDCLFCWVAPPVVEYRLDGGAASEVHGEAQILSFLPLVNVIDILKKKIF